MPSSPGPLHTFVFTDIEGSTRLWLDHPDTAPATFALHDRILVECIEERGGRVVKHLGDGLLAVFADPSEAIAAAAGAQRSLAEHVDELGGAASVRMAIHSGVADQRDGDLLGLEVNRCQRIMAAGHGGQVLVSGATVRLLGGWPPSPFDLVSLGRYRLKSLDEPENLFQLAGPHLRREFPPLDAHAPVAAHLPAEFSSFIGRMQELEEVEKLLRGSRLVTLTGEGGVGKTRLALRAAIRVQGEFPDGIWLVELAGVAEPGLVAHQVASVLDFLPTGDATAEAVVAHLAPLNALLVLDNCEHVLSGAAGIAELVLAGCPHVRVMTTSRIRLAIPGEAVYRVPPMPAPGPDTEPPAARRFDAVRLFAERAELVAPGFRLTDEVIPSVAAICRGLDGIPLAIELAAAKSGSLSPDQIADGLIRRIELLDQGSRDGGRHGTLRAAATWSFQLLQPAEQSLFTRLSVFRGGFDPTAAGSVTGQDEATTLAGLASLADQSLIRREPEGGRFRMLEPLRVFAVEWLDAQGVAEQTRLDHAGFYARLAEQADAARDGAGLGSWLDRLDRDHENLRAAFDWSMTSDRPDLALSIAVGSSILWKLRGHAAEGRRRLELALAGTATASGLRARAHLAAGDLAADLGDVTGARLHLQEAHRQAGDVGDTDTGAWALARLATIPHKEGDLAAAIALFEQAVDAARVAGDDLLLGRVLASLALLEADRGVTQRATALAAEALARSRATANPYAMADALLTEGEITLNHGDMAIARRRLEEALELGRREGMGDVTAWSLAYLGRAALLSGDIRAGRALLEKAIELFEQVGTPMGRPWALRHLALAHWWAEDEPGAEAILRQGLADAVAYVRPEAPLLLEVYAWVLAPRSPDIAARLLGCAEAQRRSMGLSLPPFELAQDAAARRTIVESLQEEETQRLVSNGATLSLTEAVSLTSPDA
jgi:predicted ATPase/class 3 adenylate cyclase